MKRILLFLFLATVGGTAIVAAYRLSNAEHARLDRSIADADSTGVQIVCSMLRTRALQADARQERVRRDILNDHIARLCGNE
jgi:hypothetical protein